MTKGQGWAMTKTTVMAMVTTAAVAMMMGQRWQQRRNDEGAGLG